MAVINSSSELQTVALVIPARNEEPRLRHVLDVVTSDPHAIFDEIIVVDDASTDHTAAVAREFNEVQVIRAEGVNPGKGRALQLGWRASSSTIIVTCDADLATLGHEQLPRLVATLTNQPTVRLVKAAYANPTDSSGRVTELVAKPLLEIFFPQLSRVQSPLSGEMALYRSDVESLDLPTDYGVDIALLIELADRHGAEAITEIPFGIKEHPHQPLSSLSLQARQVIRAILERALRSSLAFDNVVTAQTIELLDLPFS